MAWPNFSVTTAYATLISGINTAFQAVGKLFKDQTTGDYVDQIRYNSSTKKLESWSGSAWVALDMTGTAVTNATNSDTLDGQHGSYYQPASTAITTSNIGSQSVNYAASAGNADTLDGQHASAFASNAAATETASGIVELATAAEVRAGTDTVRAVTPATLRGGLNASGSAPVYAARSWVNFNGTGTVAIRASGNVSSITDINVGQYRMNFLTPLPDANWSGGGSTTKHDIYDDGYAWIQIGGYNQGSSNANNASYGYITVRTGGDLNDSAVVMAFVIR